MASQWTNKYAILRDLSFAQGRKVPADIVGSVAIGEKPPATNIKEETEEEYILNGGGDGELHTKPDLLMIKHMLDWVNEVDVVDDDDDTDKLVQISKLNPSCSEFVPTSTTNDGTLVSKEEGSGDNIGTVKSNDVETILNSGTSVAEIIGSGDNIHNSTKTISTPTHNAEVCDKLKCNNVNSIAKPKKKRRERNAALIALLEKEQNSLKEDSTKLDKDIAVNISVETSPTNKSVETEKASIDNKEEMISKELKLLKPNDFMIQMNDSDLTVTQAVEKVTEWLQTPVDHHSTKIKPITVPPSNMFKKKKPITPVLETGCMFKRKSDTSSIKSSDSDPGRNPSNSTFVPSTQANEYYKKYVERSQVQQTLQEDIWEKAERVMKEIDAKRLKEKENKVAEAVEIIADVVAVDDNATSSAVAQTGLQGLDLVRLPQHRHELPEECKVCLVLAKYRPSESSDSLLQS